MTPLVFNGNNPTMLVIFQPSSQIRNGKMALSPNTPTSRKAVGIDLGTTFSAIAHIDAYGKPQIIPNSENERITPSVILFDEAGVIVGSIAKQNAVAHPERIVDFV